MNTEGEGWNHNQNVAWLLPRISADSCQWRQLTSSSVLLGRRLSLLDRVLPPPRWRGCTPARGKRISTPVNDRADWRVKPRRLTYDQLSSCCFDVSEISFWFVRGGGGAVRAAEMVRGWDFRVATISVSRQSGLWLNLLRDVWEMRRGILLGAWAVLFVRDWNYTSTPLPPQHQHQVLVEQM